MNLCLTIQYFFLSSELRRKNFCYRYCYGTILAFLCVIARTSEIDTIVEKAAIIVPNAENVELS